MVSHPRLNGALSRALTYYYRRVSVPGKLRWWGIVRRATGGRRLTVPYAGQGHITLDESDWLQQVVLQDGEYEPEVWETLAAHARDGDVLWDVGAYIGTVAIRAMLDSRVREVHCFEPNPRTLEILRLNLSLNPGSSICHELALSDRTEHRMLADVSEINAGMATLAAEGETSGIRVRCMSVDDVISQGVAPPPDLLKIDVEDWEERLLQGAPVLLTTRPPRAIVLETAVASSGAMMSDQLHALLTEAGYAVSRIERPDGAVMERENFLAVHELSA